MAVLVEAISVVVRCDRLAPPADALNPATFKIWDTETFCHDGELARVGFMVPDDASRRSSFSTAARSE
jgi:hypothetical protein